MSDDAELVKLSGLLRTARQRPEPQEKPGAGETADWREYVFGQIARAFLSVQLSTEQASNLRTVIATGMAGIAPKDALKEMIAAQMLACHDAAIDCYRLAMKSFEESKPHLQQEHLTQAGKLSRTFAMLLDALNRHRGKGQQRIVVEHVTVHPGAQAVVGIVATPEGGGIKPRSGSRSNETGIGKSAFPLHGRKSRVR